MDDPLDMVEGSDDHAISNSVTASSEKGAEDNGSSKDTACSAVVGFAVAPAGSSSNSAPTSAVRGLDKYIMKDEIVKAEIWW